MRKTNKIMILCLDEFKNVQPNFTIINGFYGYGIKTPLTDTALSYIDPSGVVSDKFDERFTKKLCETCSLAACNKVRRFEYTKIGKKVCRQICQQQNKLICPIQMGKVKLTHSYCSKVGSHLMQANTCICAFEISFSDTFNFVFFHFTPNFNGQLSMIYFEAGSICQ
ncbi:Hypothetical protein CINCED_3A022158 [Cinara cedri]|uniref:Uncharacterized protein n=1 Tax=Cinara cedri TaxID=506608 RepID=A0A5E4MV26_9HEMI|nr:Hypothetical protein CINCED_3A022158 [Cinara cedri]